MSEKELLQTDEFKAFCNAWQADTRCPAPLIDWFLDRDQERLATAARWAVNYGLLPTTIGIANMQHYFVEGVFDVGVKQYAAPIVGSIFRGSFHDCITQFFLRFDSQLAYPSTSVTTR